MDTTATLEAAHLPALLDPQSPAPTRQELRARISQLEQTLAQIPGAVFGDSDLCPLKHSFGDGVYVREIFLPKGTVLMGKIHKHAHPNFLMRGEVLVVTESGGREHLKAPLAMISQPGTKRAVVALEDTVWITVHANPDNTRDLAVLEAQIIAPDYAALAAHVEATYLAQVAEHTPVEDDDRADYLAVLEEVGVSQAYVRALTENEADQIPMPHGYAVEVRRSPIDGLGVFVTHPCEAGEVIAPARLGRMRTPVGRYTNHARRPTCQFVVGPQRLDLVALAPLERGDEATVDYRAARRAASQLNAQMGLQEPEGAAEERRP
jgi:hypothetical protein